VLVLLFLVAMIVIYISEKKREIEFLLATVLLTCGSGTVQNRVFGKIRYRPFVF